MNAQYVQNTESIEDRSSGFLNMGADGAAATREHRQWDTPVQLKSLATEYQNFTVLNCKFACQFRNTSIQETITIYWKYFYPKDARVRNFLNTDDFGWLADTNSLLGLQADGTINYTGEARRSIARLEATNGMNKMVLGPNTSNGLPNVQSMFCEVPLTSLRQGRDPPDIYSASGITEHSDGASEDHMSLTQTTHPYDTFQNGHIHFWAVMSHNHESSLTPGSMEAVVCDTNAANEHPLWVSGKAEYSCRVFGLKTVDNIVNLDPDLS